MRKQIDELQKRLRDQQALRDDTFRSDQRDSRQRRRQKRPSEGQQPDDGQDQGDNDQNPSAQPDQQGGNPADADLAQRQHALSDRLAELQRRLKSLGLKGEKGFDDAQKDMQEAEGDLDGDQRAGQEGKSGQDGKSGRDGQ